MLQEKATSYIGSGETDEYAHKMQAICENDNVACVYMVDENTYTGTCACCIVDTERSMYVDLKAAIYYKVDHLKEHIAELEKVSVVYSTGFFIKVSPELTTLASSHCNEKGKTYCMKTCQDGSLKFSKYQDVEDEVEELMQKWQTKN